jgi:transcriptional regulator with PAS, ATPase and Fis domain
VATVLRPDEKGSTAESYEREKDMSNKNKLDSTSKGFFSNQVDSSIQQAACVELDDDSPAGDLNISSDSYQITSPQGTVIVWDHHCSRLGLIDRVVSECGATSLFLGGLADVDRLQRCISCCAALVALGVCPTEDTLSLEVIRRLKKIGLSVISYEQDSSAWPLGIRCRALLAGASCVLDSGKVEFIQELRRMLVGLFTEKRCERNEEKGIRDIMNRFGIVGESRAMVSIFRQIFRISPLSDLPVLITGESGTGKELIAHAIHQLDPKRREGPFVAVNCGAISLGVAESELFGHKKGAFTGADHDRKGIIRSAQSGVLFLDEIGELSRDLQPKLLRVLQENRVLSVGYDEEVCVNFRVIAATNRDLDQMVERRKFRIDLFHRLNVLSIHLCPLRDRRADLKPLIEHFLNKYRALARSKTLSVGQDFVEALAELELPGNARQVENLVRRALVCKMDDAPLSLSDLPAEIWQQLCSQKQKSAVQGVTLSMDKNVATSDLQSSSMDYSLYLLKIMESNRWNLCHSLEYCERLLIEAALHYTHGNQSKAAQLLGITSRSVYNKLKKYHLDH